MKKVELLAPAGNMACLKAAIEAGCDAVYLAGKLYGARAFAGNFSNEELIEAINYAHLYGVKIYITVNTVIYENEVDNFINFIRFVHQNNVDAVLIQDLGMIDLVRKKFPNLEVHASTQMHIHNKNGALLAKKLGIKRIVIARETPIEVIKEIKNEVDIEVECFIHGALCISYSGQCYMSSLIGPRSANRGTCVQCCRKKYNLYNEKNNKLNIDEYLLSTKDLCTLNYIDKIINSGVDCLKIEGRLKSEEYVYKVVSVYRKVIDMYYDKKEIKISEDDVISLKKLFNREFTKGFILDEKNNFFTNEKRPNHQGVVIGKVIKKNNNNLTIKLTDDININDGIRILDDKDDKGFILQSFYINDRKVKSAKKGDIINLKYDGFVKKNSVVLKTSDKKLEDEIKCKINERIRKVLIDINVYAYLNKKLLIEISDGINKIHFESNNNISRAVNNPTTKQVIEKQIRKIKNTIYKINNLNIKIDDNIFINIKDINEVRRNAIELLNKKRLYKINFIEKDYYINLPNFPIERKKTAFIDDKKVLLEELNNYDIIYTYNKDLLINNKCILKIPNIFNDKKIINNKVLISDFGSLINYKEFDTDYSFNVTNSYTIAFLHSIGAKKITLSYELTFNKIKDIIVMYKKRYNKHPNLEIILSGYKEAMTCKYNLYNKYNAKELFLEDEYKKRYKIINKDKYMIICNYQKNDSIIDEYYDIGINSIRNNF